MSGPLQGIRVLDASEGAQGPWCGALLGDLGAEVIKMERPDGEMMRHSGPYKNGIPLPCIGLNRNKYGVVLDMKQEGDKEIALAILKTCDVFLENFRPGVMDRLGFSYEKLSELNPRIVYCSASGFGSTGPYRRLPSVDAIAQAVSGMISVNGPEGGPPERARFVVADLTSPLFALEAILAALYYREVTGVGQKIDCCQMDSGIALQPINTSQYFLSDEVPGPIGSASPYMAPSQTFKTKDGYVNVSAPDEEVWQSLCIALQAGDLAKDPRFATNADRLANRKVLAAVIEGLLAAKTTEEWLSILEAQRVPCGPVRLDIEDLYPDPQIVANKLIEDQEHPVAGKVRAPKSPWVFSKTPTSIRKMGPMLGEYTAAELLDMFNNSLEGNKVSGVAL